ncbi:hypothetical protein ACN9J3_04885 [Aliarcobacter butzleri]|uniref:hypothetical protein n=1 Tax=Aliarcobacter butzleri TaxID=28197 RepID=UPI003B2205F6
MVANKIKERSLKERFESRGFAVKSYAKAYGVTHPILSGVLSGIYNGKNSSENGATRKIIMQLKKDKVWIGRLPWEV